MDLPAASTPPVPPPDTTRRWVPIAAGGLIAAAWLAAIWWTVRRSLELVLTEPSDLWVCPAIYPAPPECSPEWHLSIAATSAGAVLLAYGAVVLISLRVVRGRRSAVFVALAVLMAVGMVGFAITDDPNRYLLRPF